MRGRCAIGADATGWHGVLVNDGADVQLLERCAWDAAHMRRLTHTGDVCLGHVPISIWTSIAPDVLAALGGSRRRRRITVLAPATMKERAVLFWALAGADATTRARCVINWRGTGSITDGTRRFTLRYRKILRRRTAMLFTDRNELQARSTSYRARARAQVHQVQAQGADAADYQICHALGSVRRAAEHLLTHHYCGISGGQGYMYVVQHRHHGTVVGAVLIGEPLSQAQKRSLAADPVRVLVIKRLFCADDCPVPESALLRQALQDIANHFAQPTGCVLPGCTRTNCQHPDHVARGHTFVAAAYAESDAVNASGEPLTGRLYIAAGMLLAGETSTRRPLVVDAGGNIRSTRAGRHTLNHQNIATLRPGWTITRAGVARIYLTVVTPTVQTTPIAVAQHGRRCVVVTTHHATTRLWRKRARRRAWAAVPRQVAAIRWFERRQLQQFVRTHQVALLDRPRQLRYPNAFIPVRCAPRLLHGQIAPYYEPQWTTLGMCFDDTADERTAGRIFRLRHLELSRV